MTRKNDNEMIGLARCRLLRLKYLPLIAVSCMEGLGISPVRRDSPHVHSEQASLTLSLSIFAEPVQIPRKNTTQDRRGLDFQIKGYAIL